MPAAIFNMVTGTGVGVIVGVGVEVDVRVGVNVDVVVVVTVGPDNCCGPHPETNKLRIKTKSAIICCFAFIFSSYATMGTPGNYSNKLPDFGFYIQGVAQQ